MSSTRTRRIATGVILAAIGTAGVVWQIRDAGPAAVWAMLVRTAPWLPAILLLAVTRFALRTWAWTSLIGSPVPFTRAMGATLAGDALGNLTPLGLLISEPAKVMYLAPAVPQARGLATLAAENFFYSVSVALYIVLGTGAMLVAFDLPPVVRLAGLVMLVVMIGVLAAAASLAWWRPAVASSVAARVPIAAVRNAVTRIRAFEVETYGSAGHQSARMGRVVIAETAFHLSSFLEAWLTMWVLTGTSLPAESFVLDTFNRVVNVVFKQIPLKVGVDEVTTETVALAMGLPAGLGVATALVRKIRVLGFGLLGLGLIARRGNTSG